MAKKKSFISGLDSLMEDNIDDINQFNTKNVEKEKIIELQNIDLNNITDEKVKWLMIKMMRYKDELKLWRTGKMTVEKFHESLKQNKLKYNSTTNDFEEL